MTRNKETHYKNEISRLKKIISGNEVEWLSEADAAVYVNTSLENMRKIRIQCPFGEAWKCRGGNSVDSKGRTVRRGIQWSKKWLDENPDKLVNRYKKTA